MNLFVKRFSKVFLKIFEPVCRTPSRFRYSVRSHRDSLYIIPHPVLNVKRFFQLFWNFFVFFWVFHRFFLLPHISYFIRLPYTKYSFSFIAALVVLCVFLWYNGCINLCSAIFAAKKEFLCISFYAWPVPFSPPLLPSRAWSSAFISVWAPHCSARPALCCSSFAVCFSNIYRNAKKKKFQIFPSKRLLPNTNRKIGIELCPPKPSRSLFANTAPFIII